MEPFRWRRALFLGLVSSAASLAGLVVDTFVPVLLQAGHPLWHNTTGLPCAASAGDSYTHAALLVLLQLRCAQPQL